MSRRAPAALSEGPPDAVALPKGDVSTRNTNRPFTVSGPRPLDLRQQNASSPGQNARSPTYKARGGARRPQRFRRFRIPAARHVCLTLYPCRPGNLPSRLSFFHFFSRFRRRRRANSVRDRRTARSLPSGRYLACVCVYRCAMQCNESKGSGIRTYEKPSVAPPGKPQGNGLARPDWVFCSRPPTAG
jgi:hypothetical protein